MTQKTPAQWWSPQEQAKSHLGSLLAPTACVEHATGKLPPFFVQGCSACIAFKPMRLSNIKPKTTF
eukprot:1379222-Amphidinium_carterae.1